MAQLLNTQLRENENNNSNKSTNHTLWNHEERFYKVLEHLKKQLEAGSINQEEYDIMREKAIADESDLRRKDIEYATALFGTRNAKKDDIVYYQQRIGAFIDELYINCKYSWEERKQIRKEYNYIIDNSKGEGKEWYILCEKIYNDLISGKLSIKNFNGKEILNYYEG